MLTNHLELTHCMRSWCITSVTLPVRPSTSNSRSRLPAADFLVVVTLEVLVLLAEGLIDFALWLL